MLALTTIFFTSFVIALSGALMPGPLLTATVGESARRGFIAGPMIILGHGILEAVLVAALLLGLAPLIKQETVFAVIAVAGAGILLWMAYGMFKTLPGLSLSLAPGQAKRGGLAATGVLLSLANPYWIIWWATIGLGYVMQCAKFGFTGIAVFFAGHILADLAWYAFVSAAVAKGRNYLSDRLYRGLIAACAVFLVVFACIFGYNGIHKILA